MVKTSYVARNVGMHMSKHLVSEQESIFPSNMRVLYLFWRTGVAEFEQGR